MLVKVLYLWYEIWEIRMDIAEDLGLVEKDVVAMYNFGITTYQIEFQSKSILRLWQKSQLQICGRFVFD